ncbi:DUF6083 domain-containing protein [Streptomyces sp. NPDC054962]
MRPHFAPACRHWDGSTRTTRARRPLQVTATSPSRLLRAAQSARCHQCGHRIDWYQRADCQPVALHPTELAASRVPASCRWHLSGGIAHPHSDGSPWCRIPHRLLCPAHTPTAPTSAHLQAVRRQLAVRARRLIDAGLLPPAPPAACERPDDTRRPTRPVVQMLLSRYLAEAPIEDLRCVAQTRQRRRCSQPVLTPTAPRGVWKLLPAGPQRNQLTLHAELMAIYDLGHLPYTEQLRWRTQRCPSHAETPAAADLALAGWEVFDHLLHTAHLHTRLPHLPPGHSRQA